MTFLYDKLYTNFENHNSIDNCKKVDNRLFNQYENFQ